MVRFSLRSKLGHARDDRLALVLWPIAALAALVQVRQSFQLTGAGSDFYPMWAATRAFVHGEPPYRVEGFVYPPSVLALFAPLGLLSFPNAHATFHLLNAAATTGAVGLTLRLCAIRLTSGLAAAVVLGVFLSGPVWLTLYLDNVNSVVLLLEAAALLAATRNRWTSCGVLLGLSLAIKPVLAPFVLVLVFRRQWRATAVSVVTLLAMIGVTLPAMRGASSFATDVLPFLWHGNYSSNYAINTSLRGAARLLGLPTSFVLVARIAVTGVAAALWWRLRNVSDPILRIIHETGVILVATFLLFSFSWPYYALFLLPLFVSLGYHPWSIRALPAAVAGAALYLVATPAFLGRLDSVRITAGYLLLLAVLWPSPRSRDSDDRPPGMVGRDAEPQGGTPSGSSPKRPEPV